MIISSSKLIKLARFISLTFFALAFALTAASAAQLPRFLGSERKFRSYIYNPNDVYRYVGHYTYQGFIEFGENEKIGTISMGDPSLWLFESLGNRLFLKPVGENLSETNMTVITNEKVYHFELLAREASGIMDKDLIFVVKFIYPDEKDKNIVQFPKVPLTDEPDLRDLSIYNFNYQYTGEPTIAPIRVFDNGEFTYFQFTKRSAEIPAIFTVDAGGYESLVNFRSAGEYIVVERLAPQYTLRNGSDIVCVYNMSLYSSGRALQSEIKREDGSINYKPFSAMPNPVRAQAPANSMPSQMPMQPPAAAAPAQSQNPTIDPLMDLPPGFPTDMLPPEMLQPRQKGKIPGTFF